MSKHTAVPGLTFRGTFEPDGTGTYRLISGATKADAILFAAAPELLAACKAALPAMSAHAATGCDCPDSEAARLLRAAIAKAEGH